MAWPQDRSFCDHEYAVIRSMPFGIYPLQAFDNPLQFPILGTRRAPIENR
jgi:hypothetical protein